MKNGIEKTFHPNGQLDTEVTFKNGLPNGVTRIWHPNGVLASEIAVKDGAIEGATKEWNENGVLLGAYEIRNGCGVIKQWHPDGRARGEITLVNGQTTGRMRVWDESGELIGEEFQVRNKRVSKKAYADLCKSDPTLPRYEDLDANPRLRLSSATYRLRKMPVSEEEKKKHEDFIARFFTHSNQAEAREWLAGGKQRNLGEMTPEESCEVIENGYNAGAAKITAVDLQEESTNCLIVKLPPKGMKRKRVFEWTNGMARESGFDA